MQNSKILNKENANGMSNAQLDTLLEQIARLVEASAKNVEEAAQIIREAKTTAQK